MAERYFNQFKGSLEKGVVTLYSNWTIGSSGAVTLTTSTTNGVNQNKGIQSVVRNSTGNYTITFGDATNSVTDNYFRILQCNMQYLLATLTAIGPQFQIISSSVSTGSFIVQFYYNDAGTITVVDPESGSQIFLEIILKHGNV